MFGWLEELLEIKYRFREKKLSINKVIEQESVICDSCETLKMQLAIANQEKKILLEKLLEEPKKEEVQEYNGPQSLVPKGNNVNWKARKQLLEENDRAAARVIEKAANKIDALQAELVNAEIPKGETANG